MPPLNFAVEITAQADSRYRISIQSPVGEAVAEAEMPFTPAELAEYKTLFSGQREGLTRQQETAAARAFGGRLFDFLIRRHDQINAAYFASLDRAGAEGLRIRLSVESAGELADLPWEFLRDPNRDFLALSRSTPIVRYTAQLNPRPALAVKPPLRVLVMISAPEGYAALDVEGEWQRLQDATADLQRRGAIQLERLDEATLIALQRRLRQREYHIFHYIGHSVFDPLARQGLLVFETEADGRRAQLVSAGSLSREIGEESAIRLVLLNSCQSAQRDSADVFAGVASSLVVRGVPAVVAMQYEITDNAAKAFAEEFYRAVSEGLPVDSAVSEGRRAIANRVQNLEWATPVLYMRAENGQLFRTENTAETRPVPPVMVGEVTQPSRSRRFPWAAAALVLTLLGFLTGLAISFLRDPAPATPTPPPTITPAPAGQPDLQITSFRVFPARTAPGQIFRMSVGILNAGTVPSGDFAYTWDASPRQQNAIVGEIDSLPPGASRNFTVTFAYGWWGTYDSQFIVDDVGAIAESDERNNRRTLTVEVDPGTPFTVDFALLPSLDFTEPGMELVSDALVPWNMVIGVDAAQRPECAVTPIVFVQVPPDDMALQPQPLETAPDCARLPLSIQLRQPAGNALADIVPTADGQGTIILYDDIAGTREAFRFNATLTAGQPVTLGAALQGPARIRRIDLLSDGQPVTLTRLVLLPPG